MVRLDISTVVPHFAILLNGFLIWLIWKKSGKYLESYKKILYLGAIFDFIFSIITVLTLTQIVVTQDFLWYFIVIEGWVSYIGGPMAFFLTICHIYLSYASMTVAGVQFIYRFFLIFWNTTLGLKSFCALMVLSFIIPAYIFVRFFIFFYPDPIKSATYGPMLRGLVTVENQMRCFIVADMNGPLSAVPFSTALAIGSFGLIIFCSLCVVYKLWRHQKNFASADRKIQNQITIVLFCEAMVPFLTMVVPLQFLTYFSKIIIWFPSVYTYILACCPLLNPIVKMFVISPFRRTIFGKFIRQTNASVVVTISSSTPR